MGTCVTASGYKEAEKIRYNALSDAALYKQVAAIAEFAINAKDAVDNFKKLSAVSSRGIAIEEEQQAHLRDTFWPRETQFLNEFTQDTPWESQAVLAKRYAGRMWAPIAAQFAKKMKSMECDKPRYCASAYSRAMQELTVSMASAKANVTTLSDRIAFAEVQAIRETDFARKQQAIAMRQGLVGQAASLMQSAATGLAAAGGEAASAASKNINQFAQAGARQGADPRFHANIVEGIQGSNGPDGTGQALDIRGNSTAAPLVNETGATVEGYTEATSRGWLTEEGAAVGGTATDADMAAGLDPRFGRSISDPVQASDGQQLISVGAERDTARGGKITIGPVTPGATFVIDLERQPLVDVDSYATDLEQSGPDSLPGSPTGIVKYSD